MSKTLIGKGLKDSILEGVLTIDTYDNRIGINTTTPSVALDVVGGVAISGNLTVSSSRTELFLGEIDFDDYGGLVHNDLINTKTTNYAIKQNASGHTVINASLGQKIWFNNNNTNIGLIDGNGLNITGLNVNNVSGGTDGQVVIEYNSNDTTLGAISILPDATVGSPVSPAIRIDSAVSNGGTIDNNGARSITSNMIKVNLNGTIFYIPLYQ